MSGYLCVILLSVHPLYFIYEQARNQEFFRAEEFSRNLGTLVNIQLQHEKEMPRGEKISGFFCQETLKNCILNEKFYP